MNKPDFSKCSEEELWKYVAVHLAKRGIDSMLVGGAVVAIYTEGLYKSGDLDLITYEESLQQLNQAFEEIGFVKKGMSYQHPECKHLYVQVVKGPPGIGDDIKIKPDVKIVDGVKIKIFNPTDCIRDRLAAYVFDKSRACFDQAILVARKYPFQMKKVKFWLEKEGHKEVFEEFISKIKLSDSK